MRRVHLSAKCARELIAHLEQLSGSAWSKIVEDLRRQLRPRPARPSRRAAVDKRAARNTETADLRSVVLKRSKGRCESCGRPFSATMPMDLDHFFGRVRVEQSQETCWALCIYCHRMKTQNRPDAATWLRDFIRHADGHAFQGAAELGRKRLSALDLTGRAG